MYAMSILPWVINFQFNSIYNSNLVETMQNYAMTKESNKKGKMLKNQAFARFLDK